MRAVTTARRFRHRQRAAAPDLADASGRRAWRSIRPYLGTSRRRIGALITASLLSGAAEAALLIMIVRVALALTDNRNSVVLTAGPIGPVDLSVSEAIAIAFAIVVFRLGLQLGISYLPARMSTDSQENLRQKLLSSFMKAEWSVQAQERDGHLQEVVSSEVARVSQAVLLMSDATTAAISFVTLMVGAVIVNPVAATTILAAVAVMFLLLRPLARIARRFSRQRAQANAHLAEGVSESVRLAEEVQVFGVYKAEYRRARKHVLRVSRAQFKAQMLNDIVPALYQNVAIALVLVGLIAVFASDAGGYASLGAAVLILIRALGYSQQAQNLYHRFNDIVPYAERVADRIDLYASHEVESGSAHLETIDKLEFVHVNFEYREDEPVLRDISFAVSRGESIGVVGPSGAGKSTLVQLLLRLRHPVSGQFLIDGLAAGSFSIDEWRQRVAFVPQDPKLISATVAENISFHRPLGYEAVERAARAAHVHDEIASWPLGYETAVGQRADAVSGGQRQRICIARALAADPLVLVLDEPTSALDVRSERMVQDTLERLKGDVTMFLVAHRLSTLRLCDRIIVLRAGCIEAFDEPAALLDADGFYREAFDLSQLS